MRYKPRHADIRERGEQEPPERVERADPWIIAQRWHRALARARAGEPYELAMLVKLDGPPPSPLRRSVQAILLRPRGGRKRKFDDDEVAQIRREAKKDRRQTTLSIAEQLAGELGVDPKTIDHVLQGSDAYPLGKLESQVRAINAKSAASLGITPEELVRRLREGRDADPPGPPDEPIVDR